jgi:hypothetical protein
MKLQRILGVSVLLPVLLSGCGTKADNTANANQAATSAMVNESTAPVQSNNGGGPRNSMNPNLRQMFITFQSLMQMDKTDGIGITKAQADSMIPIVQDSISANALSADAKAKLEVNLTQEQKKFLEDNSARVQQRTGNRNNQAGQVSPDSQANSAGQSSPNATRRPRPSGNGNGGNGGGNGNGGGFANIGQQLLDLLQSK